MEDLRQLTERDKPDIIIVTEVIPKAQRNIIPDVLTKIDHDTVNLG